MRRSHAWLPVVAALTLIAACGSIVPRPAESTHPSPFELIPAPGTFRLVGDPPVAAIGFAVAFSGSGGERVSAQVDEFVVGQRVVTDGTTLPDTVTIWVDDTPCAGTIQIAGEREVDGILRMGDGACEVVVTRVHAASDTVHEDHFGSVSARVPLGTTLTLTTLDGALPGSVADDADESGFISIEKVPPGEWLAVLHRSGNEVATSQVTVTAGEAAYLDFGSR